MSSSSSSSGWLLAGNTSHNYITGQSSQQSGSIFSIFSFLFLSFLNFTDNSGPISTIFSFLFFNFQNFTMDQSLPFSLFFSSLFKTSQWTNLYHFLFPCSITFFNFTSKPALATQQKKHKHSSKSPFNHEQLSYTWSRAMYDNLFIFVLAIFATFPLSNFMHSGVLFSYLTSVMKCLRDIRNQISGNRILNIISS